MSDLGPTDIPTRNFMDDPNIKWLDGKPEYDLINRKYMLERTQAHKTGSLEKIVENLVKTWEMESSHKVRPQDWGTVDRKNFFINANGGKKYSLEDNIKLGNYNMMMDQCPLYNAEKTTNKMSHELFRSAFKGGFAWELIEIFSGPPNISFSWRHWGTWEGPYEDQEPTNEVIELFGAAIARVTEDLRAKSVEVYYDPNPMMAKLTGFKKD